MDGTPFVLGTGGLLAGGGVAVAVAGDVNVAEELPPPEGGRSSASRVMLPWIRRPGFATVTAAPPLPPPPLLLLTPLLSRASSYPPPSARLLYPPLFLSLTFKEATVAAASAAAAASSSARAAASLSNFLLRGAYLAPLAGPLLRRSRLSQTLPLRLHRAQGEPPSVSPGKRSPPRDWWVEKRRNDHKQVNLGLE